jgi:2,3-bisphosphoglycerate-dependent phosphoglycerate mutase
METDRENYLYDREVDPDLTLEGVQQAKLAGDYLARPYQSNGFDPQNRDGFGLTHLYCSLMIRAVKTAQIISRKTGLPLVAMPEVHETGGMFYAERGEEEPIFIGQPGPGKSYFETEFPDLDIPEDLPEEGWWGQGKEPRENYLQRAQSVIDRLVRDHAGKDHRVGIVMHGGIFARIVTALFDIQTPKYWFLMNNCGISRIEIVDENRPVLTYMNKVEFLPDELVT